MKAKLIDKKGFEKIIEIGEKTHYVDFVTWYGETHKFEFSYQYKVLVYREKI